MNIKALRQMVIDLLDNADGITEKAYGSVRGFVSSIPTSVNEQSADDLLGDIWLMTECANGCYFLPEDHGLTA